MIIGASYSHMVYFYVRIAYQYAEFLEGLYLQNTGLEDSCLSFVVLFAS